MPLRILRRNCKQYNVVSKSTFVISVELLDNGVMECTLDAESTGRDCLLNISQRLGLHQPEFFGLRYISRGVPPRQRWVELDRPLRKQLEKHAQDSQLSLGVMFYVNDVNVLKDEMARYHYFLQLKSDVIDGKLNCSIDQSISLAAYSLQAEFGDFDPERHTVEYLRDFAILPKDLISVSVSTSDQKYPLINTDALYEAVVRQYASLIGFPPPLAEIYYIMVAQQLDGYGQEPYPAKDDAGNDILICVSALGLLIRRRDWTHIAAFRWSDIKSLLGHKRLFVVESSHSHRTMQYHFADAEVAKYVRKVCLLQSTFCKDQIQNQNQNQNQNIHPESNGNGNNASSHPGLPPQDYPDSSNPNFFSPGFQPQPDLIANQVPGSSFSLNSSFNQMNSVSGSGSLNSSVNLQHLFQNSTHMDQYQNIQNGSFPIGLGGGELYNQMQLVPTIRTNPLLSMNSNTNLETGAEELNGYGRAVSDYAAALHLRYGNSIPDLSFPKSSSQLYFSSGNNSSNPTNLSESFIREEVDEGEPIYQNEMVSQMHSMEIRDSLNNSAADINNGNSLNGSSSSTNIHFSQECLEDTPLYVFKPPPPYPGPIKTNLNSSSSSNQMTCNSLNTTLPLPSNSSSNNSNSNSNSNSNTSLNAHKDLKQTSFGPEISKVSLVSQLSPSATSSVVSAQIHNEPTNQKVTNVTNDKESGEISISISAIGCGGSNNVSKECEEDGDRKAIENKCNLAEISRSPTVPVSHSSSASCSANVLVTQERISAMKDEGNVRVRNKAGQLFGKPIDPTVLREFQAIAKTKSNPNFSTALKRENSKRNRSPDVLPYEENAIRLSPCRQNPSGYINASPLSATIGEKQWSYIVTQTPLAGNGGASALWQMVWESEIKVIVSLEQDSSSPFYPLSQKSGQAQGNFGDFQVLETKPERRSRSSSASIAREFSLIFSPKKKHRKVWVLPYEEEWRDDVPIHTEHFLCFLEEVNSIQRKVSEPSSPLTVVCGTGAGRSGIFILSDLLLHAADCGHKLRCDSLLSELRTQRMSLVSTASQYAFVLHTLAKYLAQSRLI